LVVVVVVVVAVVVAGVAIVGGIGKAANEREKHGGRRIDGSITRFLKLCCLCFVFILSTDFLFSFSKLSMNS
jgi:hypothetical protein